MLSFIVWQLHSWFFPMSYRTKTYEVYVGIVWLQFRCVCFACFAVFTPLRVGWPPTPQVYFGTWEGLRVVWNFHFPPPWGLPKLGNFRFSPPVGASQAREFSLFPAVTASQAMEFSLFPPLEALQAAEFQIARQRRLDSPPNPVFFECVSMFLQWFSSKHGTLHFCRHKTGRKHHVRQCFQLGLPKLSNFHFSPP